MKRLLTSLLSLALLFTTHAQTKLTVFANKPVSPVSGTMWGLFFEDINFGADGGLYAELVKNRSFEFPMPLTGWKEVRQGATGKVLIENLSTRPSANQRYAHLTIDASNGAYGLSNEGFRGMGFQKGETYLFSVHARKRDGDVKMRIELVNASGQRIASKDVPALSSAWQEYKVALSCTDTAQKGRLQVLFEGKGNIDIDMLSLFPQNTWKGRPGGLRADLVQLLADMKPGFLRFPGGCIVEGRDLSNRYQWKATVGPVKDRELMVNRWNIEFRHRPAPDYYQTFGLGFYEYFQLSEDVGAEPLPIINCGMACQFNSSEVVAMEGLDPYIQDALDLIEFANGPVTSSWGKMRADMGHPAPFNLKYLGIGNEQWDTQYIERYKAFEKVLKQKHPEIKLVAAAGASPEGKMFDYAWKELRTLNADLVDEHYYQTPDWFLKNAHRYDQYDRKGPKVFAGEYAAQSKSIASAENRNTWQCALSEAAFMTGLERNADVVQMASYAPLFAHVDAWQWTPDLIWFDNLRAYGTPNYYVQKLFSTNKGTHGVPVLADGVSLSGQDSLYASSVIDTQKGEVIIKLVNASSSLKPVAIQLEGIKALRKGGNIQVLTGADKQAVNSLDQPLLVSPKEVALPVKGKTVSLSLQPLSLNVIKVPCTL